MTSAACRLLAPSVVLAVAAFGCRERAHVSQAPAPRGEDAVPARAVDEESPGDEPNIAIVPSRLGSSGLRLRFCFSDTSKYDPEIYRVRVAQVRGGTAACEIRSIEGARVWNEWEVGTVPAGFRITKCDKLAPGEYEIYAFGVVGNGEARMAIDPSGSVERLPWDKHSSLSRATCNPRSGGPNFASAMDKGLKEGELQKRIQRARDAKVRGDGLPPAPTDRSQQ